MEFEKNWEEVRKEGRLRFSIKKAVIVALIIAVVGYLFVYIADYKLSTSKESFGVVLFVVMFFYKFMRNYFFVWVRNESNYLNK